MFLTRATRMSAALGPALKSPLPFLPRVKANRLRHVTLTLRKGHTFQRYRSLCVTAGGGDSTLAHLEKQQQPDPLWNRDSSGFTATERARLSRLTPAAASLSRRQLAEGGDSGVFRWRGGGGGAEAAAAAQVLFLSSPAVSCRRIIGGTMQPRRDASTTATAAAKERDAGEQRTSDGNKEEEQSLKEATTSSSSTATGEPEPEGGKPSKTQQLKKVFKEYGAVGVSFHIGISLMSLGMFYLLISSGMDMVAVLSKLGFSDAIIQSRIAAGTSTFVLAYAIHKLFAPVRISITLVSVPLIVRYFRKTGLFKPPTPSP